MATGKFQVEFRIGHDDYVGSAPLGIKNDPREK
jgi:hypothetical protein